jgi:hypothetical protein
MRISISKVCFGLALLSAASSPGFAQEKSYICAINEVFECTPVTGCARISLEDANLAGLMLLDVEKKQLGGIPLNGEIKGDDIEGVTVTEKAIILRGSRENDRAWSAVISKETGAVQAGVSTLDSSLSLLGRCTVKP